MNLSWDPIWTGHGSLRRQLGGRVTEIAPLYFLWEKLLTGSDVNSQQARLALNREIVADSIVLCLTSQQCDDLCNNRTEIRVAAFDERGRQWELTLLKRTKAGHDSGTYVLTGDWAKMVRANRWKEGDEVKIWGLPYARSDEDQWRFGRDHDFSDITFVFTTTV